MTLDHLYDAIKIKKTFLCVGLDPDANKMPLHFTKDPSSVLDFLRGVVEATADLCIAYKLNTAFFESLGSRGWALLEEALKMLPSDHFIIVDAKRGDIGNTSIKYAEAFFGSDKLFRVDAMTINPYMGSDSVKPFLSFKNKWVVLLALTSNKGADDFQHLVLDSGEKLFEKVVQVSQQWGNPDNLMYVAGATRPGAIEIIRKLVPNHFFLVPGVGEQGGDLQHVMKAGANEKGGLLINVGRSILYASSGIDFQEKARGAALHFQQQMRLFIEESVI